MLNGAGGLNADGLSLDLQFAADKTLTARKGPTPVFTRGSTGTFVGSNGLIQSAAVNAARFDHDSAGVCRGLLIEESRTNQWSASEDFGSSFWSLINTTTLNSNNTTAPDGLTTADRFTVGSTTQEYGVFRNTFSFVSGTTYTISCYFKADQVTRVSIYAVTQATLPIDAYFDLTGNGSVTANASGTASIQRLSNGWYRCVITGTALASAVTSVRISAATTGNSRSYVGNSTDSFWAWGAQLEAGSFPTSYIPTTTGSVVRSADVCSITGANFTSFWNTNEGAIFASGDPRFNAGAATLVMANSGVNANQIVFDRSTTTIKFGIANSGTYTASIQQNSTNGSFVKISGAYATNNARSALNGVLGTPDTSVIVPTNLNRFNIGASGTGNAEYTNGCISEIKYFRKPLSNAKLQSLTA